MTKLTKEFKRECGECTACCEGWLRGHAHGREFFPGHPCHFMGCNGCSIYEDRPENPCKTYACQWLIDPDVPEWMRPDRVNAIITGRHWEHPDGDRRPYLEVLENEKTIDVKALNWLLRLNIASGMPMVIQVEGGMNTYGPPEFIAAVAGIQPSK